MQRFSWCGESLRSKLNDARATMLARRLKIKNFAFLIVLVRRGNSFGVRRASPLLPYPSAPLLFVSPRPFLSPSHALTPHFPQLSRFHFFSPPDFF